MLWPFLESRSRAYFRAFHFDSCYIQPNVHWQHIAGRGGAGGGGERTETLTRLLRSYSLSSLDWKIELKNPYLYPYWTLFSF